MASISVHKGLKIQAALCVERPPIRVIEPDFKKRWRAFKEAWQKRTSTQLSIQDEIVFMRFHFHFLGDEAAQRAIAGSAGPEITEGKEAAPSEAAVEAGGNREVLALQGEGGGGLDSLLGEEGIGLAFPERRKQAVRRKKAERRVVEKVDDSNLRSLRRLAERSLYLLVRYGQGAAWTFPKADRAHGQEMRESLLRLCGRQLGERFEPYILGSCPFSYRKLKSALHPGIEGRKIFYYRARLVPGMDLALPDDSPVSDWAWCSREELSQYLREGEWSTVRDCLPLDNVA